MSKAGCAGVVARNLKGWVVAGCTKHHRAVSSLMMEALAMRDAVFLAASLQVAQVQFESDCLDLVKACRGDIVKGEIRGIIQDIRNMKASFTRVGFT